MKYGCCTQSFTIMSKENIYSNAKLTTSTIMTNATNVQIKLSFEDIQQLKGKKLGKKDENRKIRSHNIPDQLCMLLSKVTFVQ